MCVYWFPTASYNSPLNLYCGFEIHCYTGLWYFCFQDICWTINLSCTNCRLYFKKNVHCRSFGREMTGFFLVTEASITVWNVPLWHDEYKNIYLWTRVSFLVWLSPIYRFITFRMYARKHMVVGVTFYSSSVEHGVFGRTSICHHVKVLCTDQTNRNSQINRQRLRKDIEHNSSQMNASFVY